ncbi:MAG TPA: GAF domain-containing protein, partial [Actinomycetota bacterium]|nr:GAF domain-containing protein [Actinomycetota bacterium]
MDAKRADRAFAPEMDRASRDLAVIAEVGRSLIGIIDLDQQLEQILTIAIEALEGDRGSIMLADDSARQLEVRSGVGLPARAEGATSAFGEGIAGWVAEHRQPVVLHGDVSDPRFEGRDSSIGSALSLPLIVDESLLGVLNLVRSAGDRFTDEDLRLASSLADMSSLAIEKSQLHSALKEREARVTQLLAAAIG